MTSQTKIRNVQAADISAITKIYAHAVKNGTASFELVAPDEAEMHERYEAIIAGGFPYIIALRENNLVGYAYANSFRPRPAYQWSIENSVYIAPDAQGLGVGKALLTYLIEECESQGFRQMLAVIGGADHTASIRLHRSLDFELVGQMVGVGWKHGKWHDSIVMQRSLGMGAKSPPEDSSL